MSFAVLETFCVQESYLVLIERFSIAYMRNVNGKNDHVTTIALPFLAFTGYRFYVKTDYFAFAVYVRTKY